jgi:hypothetical protein
VYGYPKLGSVKFAESGYAMIAKAGTLTTANHFEELFALKASKVTPKERASVEHVSSGCARRQPISTSLERAGLGGMRAAPAAGRLAGRRDFPPPPRGVGDKERSDA